MTTERRGDKRFLLHTSVQITGVDEKGLQFLETSRLEDISDLGCRFCLCGTVRPGSVVGVMPLGQNGETLIDEFSRLFVVIWIKRKGTLMTVGARSLRDDEFFDGDPQTEFLAEKPIAK